MIGHPEVALQPCTHLSLREQTQQWRDLPQDFYLTRRMFPLPLPAISLLLCIEKESEFHKMF